MRFGFFDQLPCAAGYSERQRYQDIMAQIELGDALGLDTAWLGELHFSRAFSTLADPLMVLAAAAQRARRIRLGTAVTLLPLHNPVKTAEQAATVDLLSDGRLELGVGRGTAPIHYAGYDIPQEESRARFEEALDFILEAWTHETFSYEGKYYHARDLTIVPRPVQVPHPPVRIAANSPDTFPLAARRGLPIFATPLINPPDKLRDGLAVYRAGMRAGARADAALAFPVHVTTSRAKAREECEPSLLRFFREAGERLRPFGEADIKTLRGLSAGPRPDAAHALRRHRSRDGCLRRSRLLRGAGARLAPRVPDGRVHLLLQSRGHHGPRHGESVDDALRPRGDAALPLGSEGTTGIRSTRCTRTSA